MEEAGKWRSQGCLVTEDSFSFVACEWKNCYGAKEKDLKMVKEDRCEVGRSHLSR